jgi:glycosyltransferase involved in cell wall biosynthesis
MTESTRARNPGIGKIILLIGVFERGGAERQAFLLARELKQTHGLDVEAWALWSPGNYSEAFEAAGIPTRILNFQAPDYCNIGVKRVRIPARIHLLDDPRYPLRWVHRLWRVSRQLKAGLADVVLPFTTWPNVVAGLTYRLAGARFCLWGERHSGGERVPGIERLAVTQYRRFAANSTAGVEFLKREMAVPHERIAFIPNGIEESPVEGASDWRARLGLTAGQPLVVKVASISCYKDHFTLLRAWKLVQDNWLGDERPVLALAGGHYDTYEECTRLVQEMALGGTVQFLDRISDVGGLLHASDMGVFSSRAEGMPNAVLECMAAGKAIIATDIPGIRDALGEGANGVLVPPGDADLFARGVSDLLHNRDRRQQLGNRNRTRIRNEFSVGRMAQRYLGLVQEGLARRPQRTRQVGNAWSAENVPK